MAGFNLLDKPWIPVVDHHGDQAQVSIRQLLTAAADYRFLAADLPTTNFATLRLLLAILYRSWDCPTLRDRQCALTHWRSKWEGANLLDEQVIAYLDTWAHRFDLKDQTHPFYQVADLHTSKNTWKHIRLIRTDLGREDSMFTIAEGLDTLTAEEAARAVVTTMAFDYSGIKTGVVGDPRVSGGRGAPMGVGWCGWMGGTTLEGANLQETLLLNYAPHRAQAGTADLPIWECDDLGPAPRKGAGEAPVGQVELLTWPQRRIRLRWEDDLVTGVLVSNGDRLEYSHQPTETMTPWRFSEVQSKKAGEIRYMPSMLAEDQVIWGGIPGILPTDTPELTEATVKRRKIQTPRWEPAHTVVWAGMVIDAGIIPAAASIRIGMVSAVYGPKMATFEGIASDSLTVRAGLLSASNDHLREIARQCVGMARGAAVALSGFARHIAFAVSGDTQIADEDRMRMLLRTEVDDAVRELIGNLGADPLDDPRERFAWLVHRTALRLAANLLEAQHPSVWTGRFDGTRRITGAVAEIWLRRNLRGWLEPHLVWPAPSGLG